MLVESVVGHSLVQAFENEAASLSGRNNNQCDCVEWNDPWSSLVGGWVSCVSEFCPWSHAWFRSVLFEKRMRLWLFMLWECSSRGPSWYPTWVVFTTEIGEALPWPSDAIEVGASSSTIQDWLNPNSHGISPSWNMEGQSSFNIPTALRIVGSWGTNPVASARFLRKFLRASYGNTTFSWRTSSAQRMDA